MKRALLACLLFLVVTSSIFAQSTTVSGTITDAPDGQAWFGGTYSFVFRVSPSNPTAQYFWNGVPFSTSQTIAGALDGSANYSVSIPSTTSIAPAGSSWDLTVCPLATASCFTVQSITITGATQTVAPTPPSIRVNMGSPPPNTRAYTDTEMVGGVLGQSYYNIVDTTIHVCNATPCGWNPGGGGGSPSFASITSGTATGRHFTMGNGSILDTTGTGAINATSVPWAGITALPANCAANQFMTGVASLTLPCSTISFSQIVGTIAAAQVPGGTGCPANQYANGLNAALALACAQVSYGQISGTPTLFNQTIAQGGVPLTQRAILNLINGAGSPVSCVDNSIAARTDCTFTGGTGGGSSVGPQGTGQGAGPSSLPGSFQALGFVDLFGVFSLKDDFQPCGQSPYADTRCYGGFIRKSSTTANMTSGSNIATIASAQFIQNGEFVMIAGAGTATALTTPTGVAVAPMVNSGGDSASSQTGGAATYTVQVVAEDTLRGKTAASSPVTITTAQAVGGSQSANLTSLTRSNNVRTMACSSPCPVPTGTNVFINFFGTSDPSFEGWCMATVIDNTHFSCVENSDTRANAAIAPATLSGPTVTWFQVNRTTWTAVTGAIRYYVYAGSSCGGGACPYLGQTVLTHYDDYGATMEATKFTPSGTPTTAPAAPLNQNLSCQVSAGAGSTSLTLLTPAGGNCNAGTTVTGAALVSDYGPAIIATALASKKIDPATGNFSGTKIYIGPIGTGTNAGASYPEINSYTDCAAAGVGPVTIVFNGVNVNEHDTLANCDVEGQQGWNGTPTFSFGSYPNLTNIGGAYPMISLTGGGHTITGMTLNNLEANGGLILSATNITNLTIDRTWWSTGGASSTDYKGQHGIINNSGAGATSFKTLITKSTFITGGPGGTANSFIGASPVPSFLFTETATACNANPFTIRDSWTLNRGSFDFDFESSGCTSTPIFEMDSLSTQDNLEPALQTTGPFARGIVVKITNSFPADKATALYWAYRQGYDASSRVYVDTHGIPTGGRPFVGGPTPIVSPQGDAIVGNLGVETTNCGTMLDTTFSAGTVSGASSCQKQILENLQIGAGQIASIPNYTPPAPALTCTTGSGSLGAATYPIHIAPWWALGPGEGTPSPTVSCTVGANGSILIDWSAAASSLPTPRGWNVYGGVNGQVLLGSQIPAFPASTTSFNYTSTAGGLGPYNLTLVPSGPSGFTKDLMTAPQVMAGDIGPNNPCLVAGALISGCTIWKPSSPNAIPQPNTSVIHALPVGWECSINGGGFSSASCPGSSSGGGAPSIIIPPVPQIFPLQPQLVFNTPSASVNANISATNMVALTNTIHQYKFEWVVSLTVAGTSCVGSTTVVLNAIFQNPSGASPTTQNVSGTITLASSGNGTPGFIASGVTPILAAPGTAVQYSTSSFTGGGSCSPNPKYQVQGTLVQEF